MLVHWYPLNSKSNPAQSHKKIKELLNLKILKKGKSKEDRLMGSLLMSIFPLITRTGNRKKKCELIWIVCFCQVKALIDQAKSIQIVGDNKIFKLRKILQIRIQCLFKINSHLKGHI